MSSFLLNDQKFFSQRKFSFPKALLPSTNFSRKISLSVIFNNLKTIAEIESCLNDPVYQNMVKKMYQRPLMGHNLLLIQPRIKFGPKGEAKSSAELKLSEAVALVETLPDWKVVEKCIISVSSSLKRKLIFGEGNLELIKSVLQKRPDITGIFFGVDQLAAIQSAYLEEYFNVQIFDRYHTVLQIFHAHAHTKEAKLQIALAEIPYLRVKLCEYSHTFNPDIFSCVSDVTHLGGCGDQVPIEYRREILDERELKIKKELGKLKKQRNLLRQNNRRKSYPIIAVVGYTNCGKTTLIKALTNDGRLKPEDKLFATLDVTFHGGFLPSSQKVLYIDTVGFISDVPVALVEAFKATLEDVVLADIIVHVRDISNPHSEAQKAVVLETLRSLHLPDSLMESIIEVGNKVDLLDESKVNSEEFIPISATEGTNLQKLSEAIEEGILENTDHCIKVLRIPNGGDEYCWLYKEATIRDAIADETDCNYLIVDVIISHANYGKFTHIFGDLSVCLPNRTSNL